MILKHNEPLSKHVTIKIGGIANNYYIPENVEELKNIIKNNNNYYIISGGSNLLINDEKVFENVISMDRIEPEIKKINDDVVYVGASVRIQKLINQLTEWELGGFEFLYSLPAYMGGIVYMNAGRGSDKACIGDFIVSVKALDKNSLQVLEIPKNECEFRYRQSIFQNDRYIILGCTIKATKTSKNISKEEINKRLRHVKEKQDMRFPNFGSVFMRSNQKIMKILCFFSRFKKKRGICYSDKSLNWFINCGDGKYKQAIKLINKTKRIHKLLNKKCDIEVRIWD